jgi:hypothetical protein
MKLNSLLTGIAMLSLVSVSNVNVASRTFTPSVGIVASAAEGPSVQEKIALFPVSEVK